MVDAPVLRQRAVRRLTLWVALPLAMLCVYCIAAYRPPTTSAQPIADKYALCLSRNEWILLKDLYDDRNAANRDLVIWKRLIEKEGPLEVSGMTPDQMTVAFLGTRASFHYMLHFPHRFVPVDVTFVPSGQTKWKAISIRVLPQIDQPIVVQQRYDKL
jgi:hypothetical protein